MIIERLDLKAFGRFTDVSIDLSAAPRRFHLIYGLNESGKSTSLRAITSLLFGMTHVTEDNYLHPNAQIRVGGVIVDASGNRLECIRRRGRKATLRHADDNEVIDESRLEQMLGGVNRETFLSRFGLSHDELVAGGAAILSGEGDLGQILFAAGAGIGKLREIQSELDEVSSRLFTPRGSKGINASIKELEKKRKELRAAQIPPAEFSDLQRRITDKQQESKILGQAIQASVVELARLRSYGQAIPLLPEWRANLQSLQKVRSTPIFDEAFTERRRTAISDRDVAISRQTELQSRIADLTKRLDGLPVDSVVMNHESEIQAVFQEIAARDKADRDRLELIRVQKNTDRKIIALLRELSIEIDDGNDLEKAEAIDESVDRLRVSDTLRSRIHELASQYERLIGQRNDSSDLLETIKRRLSDLSTELESLGSPGDPAILTSAIEAIGNPQGLLESLAEQQESLQQQHRRCEDQLRRLEGFEGSMEEAAKLQPPNDSVTQRLAEQLRSSHQKVLATEDQAQHAQAERDEISQQIRDDQSSQPLPTIEELNAARVGRDRTIVQLADSVRAGNAVAEQVESLRQSIRLTDQLVDTMQLHYEQVHRRQAQLGRLTLLDQKAADCQAVVAAAKNEFQSVKEQWLSVWEACGVTAGQPERMQRWLGDHEQLRELLQRLGDEQAKVQHTQQRIARAARRLRSVLASVGSTKAVAVAAQPDVLFDDSPDEDLIALYDEAVALRSQSARSRQHYDALSRRRDELAEEMPEAETKFEAAQKSVEQWRQDWTRTTESFVRSGQSTTRQVLQMLDQIHDLCDKKRERDILATRIRSIGEDELGYAARVKRLASATGEPLDEAAMPTAIAQSLYQRLQAERTASRGRESLSEQIDAAKQRLAEIASNRSACELVLKQLCAEAGCETTDELPEIERAARERSRLQASLRDLENQLAILAAEQPLEDFLDAAGEQQPALLEVEIERRENELQVQREKLASVQQEIGALQHELNLMDGSSRASDLVQSIQLTVGEISHDAEEFARVKIASMILRRAIDHYRNENQSPVLEHANGFFRGLTCGEYQELKPDYDAKGKMTLFGIQSDGKSVPVGAMSAGTSDSLYLALRLASLQHQMAAGQAIPLVIDDCLIQLDDRRAAAALTAFSDLSEKTQIILFTHHDHLLKLAQRNLAPDGFHVHQL